MTPDLSILGIDRQLVQQMRFEQAERQPRHNRRTKKFNNSKYPWNKMDQGDTFMVYGNPQQVINSLTSCRWHNERRSGRKFNLHMMTFGVEVKRVR